MTTIDSKLLMAGGITDDRDIPVTNCTDQVNILVECVWKHFATMVYPKVALTAVSHKTKLILAPQSVKIPILWERAALIIRGGSFCSTKNLHQQTPSASTFLALQMQAQVLLV